MMKKKLDAVIFDFDGVLVDSVDVKTTAFAELYSNHGEAVQKQVVEYHLQNKGVSRLHKFRYYQAELLEDEVDEITINGLADRFAGLVKDKVITANMIPGAEELLQFLYNNVPMYVASGTPEEELLEIIKGRNMQYYFNGIYGSPNTKTDIIRNIIDSNGYNPACCIMVGDAMEDYKAARNNHCEFIGLAYKAASELPKEIQIIPDLRQFRQLLDEKFEM